MSISSKQKNKQLNTPTLRDLSELSLINRVDSLFAPKKMPSKQIGLSAADVEQLIQRSQQDLKKKLNVTPRLSGSLPLKLSLPHDTDIDYFIPVKSQQKYQRLINRLEKHPSFENSRNARENHQGYDG